MKSAKCIIKTNRTLAHFGAWQVLVMVQQMHQHTATFCRFYHSRYLKFQGFRTICHQQNQQRIYLNHALRKIYNRRGCWIRIEYQVGPPPPPTTQARLSTICSITDPGFGLRLLGQTVYFCQIQTWSFPYIMSAQKPSGTQRSAGAWGVTLPFLPVNSMRSSSWRPKSGRTQQMLLSMLAWLIASSICALMWVKLVPCLANRLEVFSAMHCLMRVWWHVKMPFTYLQQVSASVLRCNINVLLYIIIIIIITSSTAQGGGGSFKKRKTIGEIGCCEPRMSKQKHWPTD